MTQKRLKQSNHENPHFRKTAKRILRINRILLKFAQHYAEIAAPQIALLSQGEFQWLGEAQLAFLKLKLAMVSLPVLAFFDFLYH